MPPLQGQSQRIEGFDGALYPKDDDKKTVIVEGLGEVEYRNEVITPPLPKSKSQSSMFGEEIIDPKASVDPMAIPEPFGVAKVHNHNFRVNENITRGSLSPDTAVGPVVPDLTHEIDQTGEDVPLVSQSLSDFNVAHSHAKFNGLDYILVSKKVFDYFMRSQVRNKVDPDLDYFWYQDVKVFKEGTKEKIERYESRKAQ